MKREKISKFTKRQKIVFVLFLAFFCFTGCRDETYIKKKYQLDTGSKVTEEIETTEAIEGTEEIKETQEIETTEEIKKTEKVQEERTLVIYICGAVNIPGVYKLPEGARVVDAIAAAGGLRNDADTMLVNQARILADGEQIQILTIEEAKAQETKSQPAETSGNNADEMNVPGQPSKININQADDKLLMTLPGIGQVKADAIIQYRKEHGAFTSITDIMKISGIKESVFSKIKDLITI